MKKEHEIIMLPSEKQQESVLCVAHKQLSFSEGLVSPGGDIMPQHLYILSDEEIKEGDWVIQQFEGQDAEVCQITNGEYEIASDIQRKIIATTDPELRVKSNMCYECNGGEGRVQATNRFKGNLPCNNPDCVNGYFTVPLPPIPQHIIEAYVKKPFDKVMVEYEDEYCTCLTWKETYACKNHFIDNHTQKAMCSKEPTHKPKLNQDGTIVVSLVEEKMYSREEVEELCRNSHLLGMKETLPGYPKPETIDEWIKENL
jgi:hypothetical protein